MKAVKTILILLLLCFVRLAGEMAHRAADEAMLTTEECAKAMHLLNDSEKEFYDLVERLSDGQWNYKLSVLRWPAGETVQHTVLAEGLLFPVGQLPTSWRDGRYTRISCPFNSPACSRAVATRPACPTRSGSSVHMIIPAWLGCCRCSRLKSTRLSVMTARPVSVALANKSSSEIA